ncbi:ABC transporter substrate-binding protein, partial [Streptomyces sp. SID10244]|nr:ABC transporter substrate-binding protein [Streptomyces sp. SID10244]
IADAMYAQKLIAKPLTDAQLREHIDYSMLATATGQPSTELGDAQ